MMHTDSLGTVSGRDRTEYDGSDAYKTTERSSLNSANGGISA